MACWIVIVFVFATDWSGSWFDRTTDRVWHSFKDDAEFSNVTADKRPHDCDFFHAPIGSKGCEYKKQVDVFGPKERQALADAATTPEDKRAAENMPNSVRIFWTKEEE